MNKDVQSENRRCLFCEKIEIERCNFIAKTGNPPKFLYLAPKMRYLLLHEARLLFQIQSDDIKTFLGMTIVDMVWTFGRIDDETWGFGL